MSDPSLEAQVQNLEARLRAAEEKATALATRNYELRVENDANDLRPVWEQVIEDMRARDQLGRERYGTPLQPFNGRDAATDEYEEALDRIVYAKQRIIETREMKTRLLAAIEQIATLEREAERNRNDGEKRLAHWERLLLDEEKRANAAEAALSASQERERRMRSVLERLNRKGGLGYELHDEITAALAPAPETATVTPRATESWMPCGAPVGNTGYACSLPAGHDGHWYIGPRVAKSTPAAPETPKAAPPPMGRPLGSMGLEAASRAPEPRRSELVEVWNDGDTLSMGPGFTTVRACRHCGVLIAGGPTACIPCANSRAAPTPETAGEARPGGLLHPSASWESATDYAADPKPSPLVGSKSGGSTCVAHSVRPEKKEGES